MQTIKVSATKARNNFFELLDQVAIGANILIEKDKKTVARMTAIKDYGNKRGLMKALEDASVDFTYSEKDNPLRRSGAADFLGSWDKKK